ncbi:hypothetical protein TI04_04025 [Achromatium sp. WMS2]|nr:hypothetical protein TI04_04025 [Achromatium sp. WMS2]
MNPILRARGDKKTSNKAMLLSIAAAISVISAFLTFLHTQFQIAYNERYMREVSEQQILAQKLAKYGLMIAQQHQDYLDKLLKMQRALSASITILTDGSETDGIPPSPEGVTIELATAKRRWGELRTQVNQILNNKTNLNQIYTLLPTINGTLKDLEAKLNEINQLLATRRLASEQMLLAANQMTLLQRIEKNLYKASHGTDLETDILDRLQQDLAHIAQINAGMLGTDGSSGGAERIPYPDIKRKLEDITTSFKNFTKNATKLVQLIGQTKPAFTAINMLSETSDTLDKELETLLSAYRQIPGLFTVLGLRIERIVTLLFIGLAIFFLVSLFIKFLNDSKRGETESKRVNETNQKAILRLLDEMGDLADGDLTVTATVTEDITGAIADSINYAIDALRKLVIAITKASANITLATQESRNITNELAEASEEQAEEITETTGAINEMAKAIDGMASNAKESAEVAKKAVEIANKGAATVRNTIQGMDGIREQIQETSKRIKRLGESSQEIGEIVELIDDIADQTNILALNAAMQAAMAGEAGRGFAVVADEVQRLAERSSGATRQIEALVKTIQADTNEAVFSMEATTAGVVKGARLAVDAGKALGEIEEISNYIAGLTKEIADSAQHQSQSSFKLDHRMSLIQGIATRTAEGARQTAKAVGALAEHADALQRSAEGFRLPPI